MPGVHLGTVLKSRMVRNPKALKFQWNLKKQAENIAGAEAATCSAGQNFTSAGRAMAGVGRTTASVRQNIAIVRRAMAGAGRNFAGVRRATMNARPATAGRLCYGSGEPPPNVAQAPACEGLRTVSRCTQTGAIFNSFTTYSQF
jgi:hypothetical protein